MVSFLARLPDSRWFQGVVIGMLILVALVFLRQAVISAYRFYPSPLPGYTVQAFDSTPRWAGIRALFFQGINPYSAAGDAVVETMYFGRPLQAGDSKYIQDEQHFAYPLYVAWLYLPTIYFNFSTALIFLWLSMAMAFVAGVWFWFDILEFPVRRVLRLLLLLALLVMPFIYDSLQSRQPALWVWFFVAAAVWCMRHATPRADALAGFFLVWSTIKPQSTILVVAYIFIVYYLFGRGLAASKWFLAGFLGTGILLLALTQWLLPTWVPDFIAASRDYRNYAGETGAEVLFGDGSTLAFAISLLATLPWLGMIYYQIRHPRLATGHWISLAYALALQAFILPTHSYNFIFGLPLLLIGGKWLAALLRTHRPVQALALGLLLALTLYLGYLAWLNILVEGTSSAFVTALKTLAPGRIFFFPVVLLLLGVLAFWQLRASVETQAPSAPALAEAP